MSPGRNVYVDDEVLRILDGVRGSVGAVETARTLPAAAYTSPSFFEFEREVVFRRSWLYLCHVSEIPRTGDRVAVDIAGEPLVVTRDSRGGINVLSSVCQHRGYVLTDEDGSSRHLRCPYHAWTYDLDGRLMAAPSMSPAHDLERLKATVCLPKLRTEIWHGMVFANFDDHAAPLAESLAKVEPVVEPYGIEDLVVVESVTLPDQPFNWKNMQENALEEYHTTYVHKGYHENAPAHLVRHGEFEPGDAAVYRHAGLLIPGGEPVPNRPTFPVIEGLPDDYRRFFLFVAIPPLMFAAIRPDGIKLFRIVPDAVDRMTLKISFLFPRSTTELPDFEAGMVQQRALIEALDRPDLESNTRMYRGLRSSFAPRGPYSPQEASLPQFNQWLLDRYQAADAVVV